MSFVQTDDGVRISYRARGEGPVGILFMHGWSASGAYFDETLKYLDLTGLRAITMDLRGHGDSEKPDTVYTDERFAKDAFAVADDVQVAEIVVVGYSMSGRFAQYLSVVAPERMLGQVLVSGCPPSPIPLPEETRRDWVARAGDAQRLTEVATMFMTKPVDPAVLKRFGNEAAKAAKIALDETLKACMYESFAEKLESVRTPPTLVIGGIHDPLFSPDVLRGMVASIPRARLALLDSNHEVPIEQPREFAALLEAFLAGLGC
jgi:pimeloyl-ACP methyl ester carboxylesterase